MKKQKTVKFTLVELLVVIAVIAVLASMLLPALNKARDTAHAANCAGNIRQILVLSTNYRNDYNDYFPPYTTDNATNYFWTHLLVRGQSSFDSRRRNLKMWKLFACPKARGDLESLKLYEQWFYNGLTNVSYGINVNFIDTSDWSCIRGSRVRRNFSTTPSYIENNKLTGLASGTGGLFYGVDSQILAVYHSKKANIGFFDGHVGTITSMPFERTKVKNLLENWK